MPVNTLHPAFQRRVSDLQLVRDSVEGQTIVKARRNTYLPAPPGMGGTSNEFLESGKRTGNDRYSFYMSFAEFPELVAPTLAGFQGIIHDRTPLVELPPELEYLRERATPQGESLQQLWELLTSEVLTTGRMVMLADITSNDEVLLAPYASENMINWRLSSDRPELVVLREFVKRRDDNDEFVNDDKVLYRVLRMQEGVYTVETFEADADQFPVISLGAPGMGTFPQTASSKEPVSQGEPALPALFGTPLGFIPLVVANPQDLGFEYGDIPALPLARLCMSIYRKSADYHRSLYIKGDPQVVISGATADQAPTKIGGGTIWTLPSPQARAEYLDIDGQGIPLMREAIMDKYAEFDRHTMQLVEDRGAESGEALRRRQFSKHVTLKSITVSCGEAMEHALRICARIRGLDPDSVRFVPDTDFAEPMLTGREMVDYTASKNEGFPISRKTLHELARRGGLTRMDYDEETSEIQDERSDSPPEAPPAGP